ncbi:cytochrome c assembly protein [Marinithermus hydrothermalis DSM 14884]|uniref:Heme exporter protein C n=2 Tax=Marinithermus TaxID=186191 RepID=F2NLU9_MARHT|nr:cytochrome c assembly protein [Marinithermus hydrothermalis DSM 14884]
MMNRVASDRGLDRLTLGLLVAGFGVLAVGLYYALAAPPDVTQGYLVRIMYLHVGAAWTAYLAFFVAMGYAVAYLWKQEDRYDRLSAASAELGVIFTALTLLSGMLWGRPTWGVYWTWEPRLTTTAILFVFYIGYFLLRQAIEDPEFRAKAAAAAAILGVINVPISYMSVRWWRSLHQTQSIDLTTGRVSMDEAMLVALLVNFAAFNLLYLAFLRFKGVVSALEAQREELDG